MFPLLVRSQELFEHRTNEELGQMALDYVKEKVFLKLQSGGLS